MSILGTFEKQPGETETYSINYALDLIDADAIRSCVLTSSPAGITVAPPVVADTRVRIRISGGTHLVKYKITATTSTEDDRVMQDEFYVKVKET